MIGRLSQTGMSRLRDTMARHVEHGASPGLVMLVSRGGDLHVEAIGARTVANDEPIQRDTIFRISSLTKPITAVAAMMLVEECKLRLDDPVDDLLPELGARRVLTRLDGPLSDTVSASRPISVRDLLTLRMGLGHIMEPSSEYPIRKALNEHQLLQGAPKPQAAPAPDQWMRRVGALPLMYHPGDRWLYDIGFDVLGVLVARASDQPLDAFMRRRIFEPLGMRDTGFSVPAEKVGRLSGCYQHDSKTGELRAYDDPRDSQWSRPPEFPSGAGGLVSTVDDYCAFCRMMLNKGKGGGERILSRASVELMTMDHLTLEQRAGARMFLGDDSGWGFGLAVCTERDHLWSTPGRFGWDGGLGASAYTDPVEGVIGIVMAQRLMDSPGAQRIYADFWTSVYRAIDD